MSAPHPSSPRSPSHHPHNITPCSLSSPALGILRLPSSSPISPVSRGTAWPAPTFGRREHGGGQLALLRLQVPQGEPARVPAGDHRHQVVRVAHVARRCRGLQHGQPEGQTGGGNVRAALAPVPLPRRRWGEEGAASRRPPPHAAFESLLLLHTCGGSQAVCAAHGHGDQSLSPT